MNHFGLFTNDRAFNRLFEKRLKLDAGKYRIAVEVMNHRRASIDLLILLTSISKTVKRIGIEKANIVARIKKNAKTASKVVGRLGVICYPANCSVVLPNVICA